MKLTSMWISWHGRRRWFYFVALIWKTHAIHYSWLGALLNSDIEQRLWFRSQHLNELPRCVFMESAVFTMDYAIGCVLAKLVDFPIDSFFVQKSLCTVCLRSNNHSFLITSIFNVLTFLLCLPIILLLFILVLCVHWRNYCCKIGLWRYEDIWLYEC